MANEEHVALVKKGAATIQEWRSKPRSMGNLPILDLTDADLIGASLANADLRGQDLGGAILIEADLRRANLSGANLSGANLSRANLLDTDLSATSLTAANFLDANLSGANRSWSDLVRTNFNGANLSRANLYLASLGRTIFADTDLSKAVELRNCRHRAASSIDFQTLEVSGQLPMAFLRGCGLSDREIEYLPSLFSHAFEHYSCFISYSSKDQDFADRLHADLQDSGVRCWFAPHDLPIGAKTWDEIDRAIRLRDKHLLILSENSLGSDWVEDEVTKAFAEERSRKELVLFPIRIDDAVMQTSEPWAVKLRDGRNIGDLRNWKEHDAYRKGLVRLLRDLTMKKV